MSLHVARELGSKSGTDPEITERGVRFATELAEMRGRERPNQQDAKDAAKAARNPKVTNIRSHARRIDEGARVKRVIHALEQIKDVYEKWSPTQFVKFMTKQNRDEFDQFGDAIDWLVEVCDAE